MHDLIIDPEKSVSVFNNLSLSNCSDRVWEISLLKAHPGTNTQWTYSVWTVIPRVCKCAELRIRVGRFEVEDSLWGFFELIGFFMSLSAPVGELDHLQLRPSPPNERSGPWSNHIAWFSLSIKETYSCSKLPGVRLLLNLDQNCFPTECFYF